MKNLNILVSETLASSVFENRQTSELLLDISSIIKEKKWKSTWLILCKEKYSWYVIYKVYWKKAVKSFAKQENPGFWWQKEFCYLKNEDILITKDA